MKGEVLEAADNLKEMNKETYYKIVDDTAARYEGLQKVSAAELRRLTRDLKDAWEHISKELAH